MRILIAGYPYVKENYFKTFDYYPDKGSVFFILPKRWKAKEGKLNFCPPKRENVYAAEAYFCHSNYPIIGGVLKGWMPAFPVILSKLRKKIDIVYSPSEPILLTTLYQGFWSKIFGKKHVIFTWENIRYEDKFKGLNLLVKKIILKLNLTFCEGIICGNKKAQEIMQKHTNKPTAIIPLSGVDTEFYNHVEADDVLDEYNLRGKFIYTFAGAIGYRKGVHLIIEALAGVINQIVNAHLIIVGTGEYEESLKLKIESLKLGDHITFIPWTDALKLRKILSISKVFLYPSLSHGGWEEQFGYSMAEASLVGLPIIATKSGSIDEVVIDGKTGILIEQNNKEELANAMIKLAQDDKLRAEMGENGKRYIIENFSYEKIASKFYEFFNLLRSSTPK